MDLFFRILELNLRMITTTITTTKLSRTQTARVKKGLTVLNQKKLKKARNLTVGITPEARVLLAKLEVRERPVKAKVKAMTKAADTDTAITDTTGITTEDEAEEEDTEVEVTGTTAGDAITRDTEGTGRTYTRADTRERLSGRLFTAGLTKKSPI